MKGIPFESQKELTIYYKSHRLKKSYAVDFLGYSSIVVEIKALDHLTSKEESQLLYYLKATGLEVGVLINFGAPSLEWKRMVKTQMVGRRDKKNDFD